MSNAERYELKILAGIFLLSLAAGLLADNMLVFPLLGSLAYLAWHLYQLFRLTRLIRQRRRIRPPYPQGLWGEIHRALERAQSSGRKRKRGLVRFASRFRKAAAAMPDGLILQDRNQRIEWANPAASTLLGIHFPADEGKRLLDLLRYPFLEEYLSAADFNRALEFPAPGDRGLVISLQIIPFGEKKRHRLLVIRNITQLYNLDQIRKDFVANVSHELKTPLTVIAAFIENLLHATRLPAQERPLLLMQQQSGRMASTIDDLLTLSQLEMEQEERIQELVQIPDLLAGLIEEARSLSGVLNHSFQLDINPNLGLLGNELELQSAFSNLIFNAVKYTPTRANIRVFWGFEDGNGRFIVSDSGEGIAARHIPRLTERFYRVDTDQAGGTGLGLAIVKHAVSRHSGELVIQSKIGMGSTFRCDFPEGAFCFVPVGVRGEGDEPEVLGPRT